MIHISIEGKEPDNKDWLDKANRLTEQLKAAKTSEDRKAIIEKNNSMWSDIKDWLVKLSHGKCWYSEAKEIFSIYDVDHFRPKNSAKNLDNSKREGYWWLAFDWKNYRLSGSVGNRLLKDDKDITRGKWDYFPLKENCRPASSPNDDLRDELYYLLDPTNPNDPLLLSFDETGNPVPVIEVDGSWATERVKVTINLLHLDYVPLVEERRKIWELCRRKLDAISALLSAKDISVTKQTSVGNLINELREMASSESELAGTVRACLLKSGGELGRNIVTSSK